MKQYYFATWKEFANLKMVEKGEIIFTDNIESDMQKLKIMNNQKRLTTTEYSSHNLTEQFEKQGLKIIPKE